MVSKDDISRCVEKIVNKANGEDLLFNLYGPWFPAEEAERNLISAELKEKGFHTIRLSEHADLYYTDPPLSPEEIEECRQIVAKAHKKAVRMWENPPTTIVMICPMPDSPHTPDSPLQ